MDYSQFSDIAPTVRAALLALGKAVEESGLETETVELVKLRASQINACAFCTQLHLNFARKHGVPPRKLDLVAAWRDAGIYSDRERAALAWTEALTDLAHSTIPDELYANVSAQFDERELTFLTAAIANINAWNRIAGPLRFPLPDAMP
jgi:AhpD family alkylhydroperoxidase